MRIQDVFKQVAKENANKIAVKMAGWTLTYQELDRASDNLAQDYIQGFGPDPQALRVHLDAAKILGAIKAGKIAAVMAPATLHLSNFAPYSFWEAGQEITSYNDGAFLAFTSGSTGSSKAVVYSHRGMIALARVENSAYNFKADEVIGSYRGGAPLYRTLCDALLNGLTLSLGHGAKLDEWIVNDAVTHLGLTATDFRSLMSSSLKFPSLRWLSVGGEMVDWDDFKWFKETSQFSDDCVFLCRYACSETHTVSLLRLDKRCTVYTVGHGRVPVGISLPGVQTQIDHHEIQVHSPWLAIEYWQDDELTRKKFKVDGNGRRWYLTGDKGYFKDGILHHEGRI